MKVFTKTRKVRMKRPTRERKKKSRAWENLDRDVLITIYQRLDLKDLIVGAPLCCSSWYMASKDLSLWKNVDVCLPFKHRGKLIPSTKLIEFVVARSRGSLTSLQFPRAAKLEDLLYVADRCPGLKHFLFRLPFGNTVKKRGIVSKTIFSKWKELESMDVDERIINDELTLQLINRSCPNFNKLKILINLSEKTASLICTELPKLKTIDLSNIRVLHREVVVIILKGCNELENLDISGCGKINGEDEILGIGLSRLKEFKWDEEEEEVHCSKCVDSNKDCGVSYQGPCAHGMKRQYSDYIDGTYEMLYNKYGALNGHIGESDTNDDVSDQDDSGDEWWWY